MGEVLIPPDIVPSEESVEIVDDATSVFRPIFGSGLVQRVQQASPRFRVTQKWRGLRAEDLARMSAVCSALQGRYNTLRARVGNTYRGSFPATELLTNNDFSNGTTGWTKGSQISHAVSDQVMRCQRIDVGTAMTLVGNASVATGIAYAPYIVRGMLMQGVGAHGSIGAQLGSIAGGQEYGYTISSTYGVKSHVTVPFGTSLYAGLLETSPAGQIAGDYIDVPWVSLSRCALVDNSPNLLTYSDQFDNAGWPTKNNLSVSANAVAAPDGTTTADQLTENSATGEHFVEQSVAVSSDAAEFACSVCAKANSRSWIIVRIVENTGSTVAAAWFNLSTGAVGTITNTANWLYGRSFITDLGGGWYRCTLVSRKTNAATTIRARIQMATADASTSYTGNGANNLYVWRGGLVGSGVPFLPGQTTSAASSGTAQTGTGLNVKGLPVSTAGLLLPGDWFEVNGELKRATAALNSDAGGLGYLQFEPPLVYSPADNEPIIVNTPLGRFILADNPKWTNQFGVYADLELTFETIYEP